MIQMETPKRWKIKFPSVMRKLRMIIVIVKSYPKMMKTTKSLKVEMDLNLFVMKNNLNLKRKILIREVKRRNLHKIKVKKDILRFKGIFLTLEKYLRIKMSIDLPSF